MTNAFPKGFEDIEKYAPEWVIATPLARQRKRADSDLTTVRRFYDAIFPSIDRVITHLNTVPMDQLSPADKNLYNLAATWMEMSHRIDLSWKETDEPGIFPFERVELGDNSPGLP